VKIGANLSVLDDVELIEQAIDHLRAIGVDLIIACDLGSSDGTYEIMERYRSDDDFWLFRPTEASDQYAADWSRANIALAKSAEMDWVLVLDADEFWIPREGSLKALSLEEFDVLSVDRFNVPLGLNGPMMPSRLVPERYEELLVIAEPVEDPRAHLTRNPGDAWIRMWQDPKVMFRPERIIDLGPGAHAVFACDLRPLRRARPSDLVIVHVPFTTQMRFARKVDNIRRALGDSTDDDYDGIAWHWRRWVAMALQGRINEEFEASTFSESVMADCRTEGTVRSVAELFRERSAYPGAASGLRACS
jgi:glycosyltransferase involved in cell wall biosynthesis